MGAVPVSAGDASRASSINYLAERNAAARLKIQPDSSLAQGEQAWSKPGLLACFSPRWVRALSV